MTQVPLGRKSQSVPCHAQSESHVLHKLNCSLLQDLVKSTVFCIHNETASHICMQLINWLQLTSTTAGLRSVCSHHSHRSVWCRYLLVQQFNTNFQWSFFNCLSQWLYFSTKPELSGKLGYIDGYLTHALYHQTLNTNFLVLVHSLSMIMQRERRQ